jgi:nicotinamide riboside transporter PnuC
MDANYITLQVFVGCTYITGDYFLAKEKISGWLWSLLGSALAIAFFLLKGYSALAFFEMLDIPFALYGLYKWKHRVEEITKTDFFMVFCAIIVIFIYFFSDKGDDSKETFSSIFFIVGGLLIARQNKIGWYVYLVADLVLFFVFFENGDIVLCLLQIVSLFIDCKKLFFKDNKEKEASHVGPLILPTLLCIYK